MTVISLSKSIPNENFFSMNATYRWICNKKTLNIAHQLPPLIYRRAPYHPALYSPESSHVQAKAFNQFFELSPITHKRNEEEVSAAFSSIRLNLLCIY